MTDKTETTTPAERRAILGEAEVRLQQASIEASAACDGDDRFTGEDRSITTTLELGLICEACPIRRACIEYADAARPAAGFWAGRWHGAQVRDAALLERARARQREAEGGREQAHFLSREVGRGAQTA